MQQICPYGCENTIGSYRCKSTPDSEIELITVDGDRSYTTEMSSPVKTCGSGMMLDASNMCVDIGKKQSTINSELTSIIKIREY